MGTALSVIIAVLYGTIFFVIGLVYWASAELPLILREIAHNTRKDDGNSKPKYEGIALLSKLLKVFAVLFWVIGGLAVIALIAGGGAMLMRGL
ncbi:MAG: hypothetical protein ACFCUH_02700 [Flavobacteriales bacterium]|jgi:Na+/H+ antiporter NhaC